MILGAREAYLNYIPFSFIALEEQPYRFRRLDPPAVAELQASLIRSGQTHPVTLLEINAEKFVVLDGHLRCDAVRAIRESGGTWEKILAQVVPYGQFSLLDRFRLLRERNMDGEKTYGLVDRGQFFRDFVALGMSVQDIAKECAIPASVVEDTIELSKTLPELAPVLNQVSLDPVFAVMLHRRFIGWKKTPHAARAEAVARKLLEHVAREKITMKTWRFLLDFYWDGDRPFLV